jgi:Xaa-Pro aminopeptidase
MPKKFSRDEYMRRWQKVRALMKQDRLDCLLVPAEGPDLAYLTGGGAGWVVFPYEGAPIALSEREGGGQNELGIEFRPDGRPPGSVPGNAEGGYWSPAIIDALDARDMSRAHIGVGNLSGVFRNEEGGVSYTTLDRVKRTFPQARFDSAADLLMRAQLVRSPEEIAVFEKATAVAELGCQALMETARPGVSLRELWITMYERMLRASGQPGSIAFTIEGVRTADPGIPHAGPASGHILRAGEILGQEITGSVLGYTTQVDHPVCVGPPAPAAWAKTAQDSIDTFHRLVEFIAPGKTVRELMDHVLTLLAEKGRTETGTKVIFNMGEGPRIGPNRREGKNLVVEAGWVINVVKPGTYMPGSDTVIDFGDPVVVTDKGARRLGKRKLDVLTLGT